VFVCIKSRYAAASDCVRLLQLSSGPQEMRCQGPYPMCIRKMPKVVRSQLFHKMSYDNKQPLQWVQQDHKALCESRTLLPSHRSMYVACPCRVCSCWSYFMAFVNADHITVASNGRCILGPDVLAQTSNSNPQLSLPKWKLCCFDHSKHYARQTNDGNDQPT